VTRLEDGAFWNCTSLASVTIYAPSLDYYGEDAFSNNADGRKIYVPVTSVDTYKAHASDMGASADDIVPIEGITLADAADNSATIAAADGATLDVTLQGRTLYKDGDWNTLCLPFDVEISGSVLDGDGVDVRTLSSSSFEDGMLTLTFTGKGDVTKMEAGKPYIIKWTPEQSPATNLVNPVFTDVTVKSDITPTETDYVDFIGTYSPVNLYTVDKTNLYLGSGNTLYYPADENFKLNACRAYFRLKDDLTAGEKAKARAFVLDFGDGEKATGIISTTTTNYTNFTNSDDAWYDLSGRKLSGKPTQKGIYIHNGKKTIIKKDN